MLVDHAIDYARRGFSVFPCNPSSTKPKSKTPLTPNGFYDATRDENRIRAWWTRWPNALIGAAITSET